MWSRELKSARKLKVALKATFKATRAQARILLTGNNSQSEELKLRLHTVVAVKRQVKIA